MQQNNIQLSILIPSIPSRIEMAQKLYLKMLAIVGDRQIEILMLTDNKIMSIGEKCNHLLAASHGKYFCFIHDDDELISLSEIYDATFLGVDVIDFKAQCRNANGSTYIVTQRLGNNVEHNTIDGYYLDCNRPPFPNCAWAAKFKKFDFPDINYGEDWIWVEQCLKEAKTEIFIDKELFHYNFNSVLTEASTEDNLYWKNPNK